jgi:putative ABC transport system permease protein
MLIAVYERTHEIGIMKSVGFKNQNILMIFLFQAIIIGLVGGAVGIAVGAGGSYGLSAVLGGGRSISTGGGASSGGGFRSSGSAGGGSSLSPTATTSSISFKPVFPITTIVSALLIAVIVSVIAGIYPAWRASKMEPIDALRQL